MQVYRDQIGNIIHLKEVPERIISLVPSQTELLFDLGLDQKIVGITKFCIHPKEKVKDVTKIGGTKNFHFDRIHKLKPDLIIGNKEENFKEGIAALAKNYPVWISDISTLKDAIQMMKMIGEITNTLDKTNLIANKILKSFRSLKINSKKSALYLIWKNPYMSIGGDTFINHMMEYAGFSNILKDLKRYPELSAEEIASLKPDYILLSSEPYPFKNKHLDEFKNILPKSRILIVDGEMFSWYGSRLQYAAQYFKQFAEK